MSSTVAEHVYIQACNYKSAMGERLFWGSVSSAGGHWWSGRRVPSTRKIKIFFCKNNLIFLAYFDKMLLKRGIRENSGGIEMSKNMVRLLTRNLQWGCSGGIRGRSPALKNFVFFCKNNLILGLF